MFVILPDLKQEDHKVLYDELFLILIVSSYEVSELRKNPTLQHVFWLESVTLS